MQTLPAASWKMLSWLRQEKASVDFEAVTEATGIFAESCRHRAVGALLAPKLWGQAWLKEGTETVNISSFPFLSVLLNLL